MSGLPPSDSDRRDPLSFDELIALIVAFLVVGVILWWSIGRKAGNWIAQTGLLPEQAATQATDQSAEATRPETVGQLPEASRLAPSPEAEVEPNTEVEVETVPRGAEVPAVVAPAVIAPLVVPSASPAVSPTPSQSAPSQSAIVVPSVSPEAAVNFSDLPSDYWAYPFIAELTRRGMISGFNDGTFRPDQPVTRTEYAAMIEKILPNAQQNRIAFNDVPAGFWGTQAIDEAVKSGFVKGYPDATFQPDQPISRMQVLLSLANGFQLPKPADPNVPLQLFDDRAEVPEWAKPAVGAATQSSVVVNHPERSQLNPNQPATRAEVAAMLYQALTTTGQLPPVESNYIVRP